MAKVALIHDWLISYRGGEKVFEAIAELFPEADIFTLFHKKGSVGPFLEKHRIVTSFLDRIPLAKKLHRYFLPLMPSAIESFDLSGYDLVISSSHCVAKGVIPGPKALHLCYSHTPMRYVWDRRGDYFKTGLQKIIAPFFLNYLRMWDVTTSERVGGFVANSQWVAGRIARYYRRESVVITPFVDDYFLKYAPQTREDFYLVVSSFAPYKRIDLAIEACARLGKKLVVVGDGQDNARLRQLAGPGIKFVGRVDDEELRHYYRTAKAMLFPGEEDFGISPLEAMAGGCPVIAFGRGGLTETVIENETGLFFKEQTVESLASAITLFESAQNRITEENCRKQAALFTRTRFQKLFSEYVTENLSQRGFRRAWESSLFPTIEH